jgi:nitroreductase
MINNILKLFRFLWEYLNDFAITIRYNTYSPFEDRNLRLYYRLIILSHAIEKGLSLANPRALFGRAKILSIVEMARRYDSSNSKFPLEMASGALRDYIEIHRKQGLVDSFLDEVEGYLKNEPVFAGIEAKGGYKRLSELRHVVPEDTEVHVGFLESRYSCRHYEPCVVPISLIEKIVRTAQAAPSQCNRQSVRVHCFTDKAEIEKLLTLQGGASGFVEGVYNLFVITSEVTAWGGYGQRNQGYVDSGLFAQQLMLASYANGVGVCPLNLAVDNAKEKKIKKVAGIHPRERLAMMISFGYPGQLDLKAARSARLPLGSVLKTHES